MGVTRIIGRSRSRKTWREGDHFRSAKAEPVGGIDVKQSRCERPMPLLRKFVWSAKGDMGTAASGFSLDKVTPYIYQKVVHRNFRSVALWRNVSR